jgi:MarR family transcriptional regulator, organic hydroperoxide resistance regulator
MTPAEELRYLVLALQREGNRQLTEVLRPLGLTPAQAEVLQVLDQFDQLTLLELGERLVCETGSPSRLVKGMVKAGYVIRTPDPNDGRAVRLSLSDTAQALMPQLNAIETAYNDEVGDMAKDLPISLESLIAIFGGILEGTTAGRAIDLRKQSGGK